MKKGFTLLEIMIATTLMSILGMAVFGLQDLFLQNETTSFTTFTNVTQANDVVRQFTREIRRATSSATGAYPLSILEDNNIVFYSDIDLDSIVERVRYTLNSNVLEKGVTEPSGNPIIYDDANERTKILSENIYNTNIPIFSFYNSSWPSDTINNPLQSTIRISDTKTVRIFIIIDSSQGIKQTEEYSLDSFVTLRNVN